MARQKISRVCAHCGILFYPDHPNRHHRLFCSNQCRGAARTRAATRTKEQFMALLRIETPAGCWIWTRARDKNGYGVYGQLRAHRVMWELSNGRSIPKGQFILHHCDNPPCCNPEHLFLGSPADNSKDAAQKGRMARGEKNANAKLTTDMIHQIRVAPGTLKEIGARFGINLVTVWGIRARRSWKHV